MKYITYTTAFLVTLTSSLLNAQLMIEDFERYVDTSALHAEVFSFGSAAQAGKPSLAEGLGENNSNAACFNLTWETGNNANLCLLNLSPNAKDLSGYSEISAFIYIETFPGANDLEKGPPTLVKLAVEGADGTIWQTSSVKASRPLVDTANVVSFRLTPRDMECVEGRGQFKKVISNVKNIRIRFEGSKKAGFRQDAYIDSIKAVR